MNTHFNYECSKAVGCTCHLLPVVQQIADKYKSITEEYAESMSGHQYTSLLLNNPLRKLGPTDLDCARRLTKSYTFESNDDGKEENPSKRNLHQDENTVMNISSVEDSPTDSNFPPELFHVPNQSCPVHTKSVNEFSGSLSNSSAPYTLKSTPLPIENPSVVVTYRSYSSVNFFLVIGLLLGFIFASVTTKSFNWRPFK